ncbi:peptidoglycan-binding protein [Candidatus Parcubacteria bacterium]|nr:peptidoglycan-binding protein [Candidatus Parcubacteria bacterium]
MKKIILFSLLAGIIGVSPIISKAQQSNTTVNGNCTIVANNLTVGSVSSEVMALQQFLTDQGFSVSIVGRFGPNTRAAVKAFQKANGIPATGFVGPMTRAVILKLKCKTGDNSNSNSAATLDTKTVALNQAMRKLWEDHITWTRLYIIETAGNLPGATTTATRLFRNQDDIGNAIKTYYGDTAGNQLTTLLKIHIQGAADILAAAKANDQTKLATAKQAWFDNANQIAAFLNQANPTNWPLGTLQQHMKEHLDLTLDEAVQQLGGNYSASVADYDKVHDQIIMLADILTKGIIAQFPSKF